jgi:phosphocarrier protein
MIHQKVTIQNLTGLHLRPAAMLCKTAQKFQSRITFTFRDGTVSSISLLNLLGACVKCGEQIELSCDGPDESEAMKALVEAIESGLGD